MLAVDPSTVLSVDGPGTVDDLDQPPWKMQSVIVPLSSSLVRIRSMSCSPTYGMDRVAGLLELGLEARERGAVERRRAVDRHVVKVRIVSVQVRIGVARVDHGVLDAVGVVLRIEECRARSPTGCSIGSVRSCRSGS